MKVKDTIKDFEEPFQMATLAGNTCSIPMSVQDEINSLVFQAAGFVARSLQIAADMRLARARTDKSGPPLRAASPTARNPSRLSLILNAHWNDQQFMPSRDNPVHFYLLANDDYITLC